MTTQRIAIATLALSASALAALIAHEGYTDHAVIPVKGDVPTLGYGSTTHADGTPVRMGDTTTREEAMQRTLLYVQKQDLQMHGCIKVPLHQEEYDVMADFAYQYGIGALCKSSMVRLANAGDYAGSCRAYREYRFVGKGANRYDCSTTINGKRNTRCWGVWQRQLQRQAECMLAQQ